MELFTVFRVSGAVRLVVQGMCIVGRRARARSCQTRLDPNWVHQTAKPAQQFIIVHNSRLGSQLRFLVTIELIDSTLTQIEFTTLFLQKAKGILACSGFLSQFIQP